MKKIGLSFSLCIKDIASGKVKEGDVEKIIAGTAIRDLEDLELLINVYKSRCWRNLPEAEAIARRFWEKGLVEQPRIRVDEPPPIWGGHWNEG
jgi:hypothetical protein